MIPHVLATEDNFALLPADRSRYETSRVVVLPVPFERTVSYGHGTAAGPAAIIRASQFVETYDEELRGEPCAIGIATLEACDPRTGDLASDLDAIEAEARRHMEAGKFVLTLGGEHSLTTAPVRAAREVFGEIGVVQFDAHSDLREEYQGTPWSHACVMKRIFDLGIPSLAVGIRALSTPEAELIDRHGLKTVWGYQLDLAAERFEALLDELPPQIYLTFDIDFFDPSLVPATGTPEPGGGFWQPTMELLRTLFRRKTVVAMDVVELAPFEALPASDFVAAKLAYKCIGMLGAQESAKPR